MFSGGLRRVQTHKDTFDAHQLTFKRREHAILSTPAQKDLRLTPHFAIPLHASSRSLPAPIESDAYLEKHVLSDLGPPSTYSLP